MTSVDPIQLSRASGQTLVKVLNQAPPADPEQIVGQRYLGLSLGLPAWVDRLAWSIFEKDFVSAPEGPRGWNVRLEQAPWSPDLEPQPMLKKGDPHCFGYFGIRSGPAGTVLDYGLGDNPMLDPSRLVRDPLVALDSAHEWLLGQSRVQLGPWQLSTPSFFLLHRLGPVLFRP